MTRINPAEYADLHCPYCHEAGRLEPVVLVSATRDESAATCSDPEHFGRLALGLLTVTTAASKRRLAVRAVGHYCRRDECGPRARRLAALPAVA